MKEIIIIVRPEKLEDIKHILDEVNCGGMTLSTVMGCGTQKGMVEEQGTRELKGFQTTINLLPKIRIEAVSYTHLDVYKRQGKDCRRQKEYKKNGEKR